MYAQSMALGIRIKFQLEILSINVISGIVYFREIIGGSMQNGSEPGNYPQPPEQLGAAANFDDIVKFGDRRQIPTFGNRCLSAIGGGKQRSRLAGWVQLSVEAAPGPHGVPPAPATLCREFLSGR